ncbi:MAG: two-component sensor histidine kinase [Hyphobacterium sp.]|nr:MAG: two-component sensor histidine kinase [Hyphobacterium sp.]
MSNESRIAREGQRLRRRDTLALTLIAVAVLFVLWITGAASLWVTASAALAIAALSLIYFLSVSTMSPTTGLTPSPETDAPAPVAAPAREILEHLPFPVLLIGQGGKIERANSAAHEFLGLGSESGLLSASLRQPQVLEAVSNILRGEPARTVEYSTLAPIESHVRVHAIPLKTDDGGAFPWHALLVLSDETSSKRVARMRSDFLANASHELRTPLASLSGFIETLRGHARDDSEAREKFLAIMHDQTERMRRLINDLLSLSRVEMDEHVPPSGHVDLAAMTLDTIDSLSPLAESRNIRIDFEGEREAHVVGERDQLFEIAQNLIENALKYSTPGSRIVCDIHADIGPEELDRLTSSLGSGSGRAAISPLANSTGKRFALLRVHDTGKGIERRHLSRLSERFYRVDGQKSGPREGTGLGLAIVKHIVSRHRGGFFVESLFEEGTVFSVCIPRPGASAPQPDQ